MPRIMCHHYELHERDREFITKKIERMKKFFDRVREVSVILDAAKNTSVVEVLVSGPHVNLRVKSEAQDMRTALEAAINKAERSLRKYKQKMWGDKMHRRNNVTIRRFAAGGLGPTREEDDGAEPEHDVEAIEPKPMSLDEAHLQMKADGREIMVFINADTDELNMLHLNENNEVELMEVGTHADLPGIEVDVGT